MATRAPRGEETAAGPYRSTVAFRRGGEIVSTILPRLALPVDPVLGPCGR